MERIGDETMVEHGLVSGKINLMTAHGAKGKEFPAVIVLQSEDFKTSEEERRLMYVAMTRAKKVLFLMESPYSTCELLNELNGYVKPIRSGFVTKQPYVVKETIWPRSESGAISSTGNF